MVYKFNKWLFWNYFGILILLCSYSIYTYGTETNVYFNCKTDTCINPLWGENLLCSGTYCPPINCNFDWCDKQFIPKGVYGEKSPWLNENFHYVALFLLSLTFLINHFGFNRGNKFSLPTKRKFVPNWMAGIIRKIAPNFKNELDITKINFDDNKEGDDKD